MPVGLSRSGSSSRWFSPVDFAKSSSVKSLRSQSSAKSNKSSEPSSVEGRDDDDDEYYDTDRSEGSSKKKGLKQFRPIARSGSESDCSDVRDEEEKAQEINWNLFTGLFPDDRENEYYSEEDDEVRDEEDGGLLGFFGVPSDASGASSTDSVSTDDDGDFWGKTGGGDGKRDGGSDTEGSLTKGFSLTRKPSHFDKMYEKRHREGTSVASSGTYLNRFSRKMNLSRDDDGESHEESVEGQSTEKSIEKIQPEGGSPSTETIPIKRSPSIARLFGKRKGKSKSIEEDFSRSNQGEELSRQSSLKRLVHKYLPSDHGEGGKTTVPADVIMKDVPINRSMSHVTSASSISKSSSLVSKISRRSQKYENVEMQVDNPLGVRQSSTRSTKSDNEAKLKQMMEAEERAAHEEKQKQLKAGSTAAALAAAGAQQARRASIKEEKKAKKAQAKRMAAEEKQKQKVLRAERKRLHAEQKKQIELEERAASIAAAEAKRQEAEARLAAMNAEAALKKREAEEKKAEEKRAAEIAAAEAQRLEAEARKVAAERKLQDAEKIRAAERKRQEAEAEKVKRDVESRRAQKAAAAAAAATAVAATAAAAAQAKKKERVAEHKPTGAYWPEDEEEARWAAVAAEAEQKTRAANETRAKKKRAAEAAAAAAAAADAAETEWQEAEAEKAAAEGARLREAEAKKANAARRRREAKEKEEKEAAAVAAATAAAVAAAKAQETKQKKPDSEKKVASGSNVKKLKQKKREKERKLAADKRFSFAIFGRGKAGKRKQDSSDKKKKTNEGETGETIRSDTASQEKGTMNPSNKEVDTAKTQGQEEGSSVVSELLSSSAQADSTSLSTINLTSTPFHRTSTYRGGDLHQVPTARSVSFQRQGTHRNTVVSDESLEQNQGNINGMSLSDNKYLSSRAVMNSGSQRSHRRYCVYEYEESGNAAAMYCEFNNDPVNMVKIYKYDSMPKIRETTDEVLIKVQASTVSYSDCLIRQGLWWGSGKIVLPATPGVDIVGRVSRCSKSALQRYGIQPDDYVASLIRSGGNARYVKVDASQLVTVPKEVDPASAACLVETYLAAFQSLQLGEDSNMRYKKDALLGKSVLIIGGIAMVGQAMIELAFLAGASTVYVTARQKHYDFLRSIGAIPVPLDIDEWLPFVRGRMDIVVDAYCTDHYSSSLSALNSKGKLVCIRTKTSAEDEPGLLWHAEALWAKLSMNPQMSRTYTYDVFESWEENLKLCKNDLKHLFDLLRMGIVEPPIADCIPLTKVPQAQRMYETRRIQGYFVCEPWLKQKKRAAYC